MSVLSSSHLTANQSLHSRNKHFLYKYLNFFRTFFVNIHLVVLMAYVGIDQYCMTLHILQQKHSGVNKASNQ